MSSLDLRQFYQTFFDEADELLLQMEQQLLQLDVSTPDPEALNAIFRAAHSIKGGAATFGTFPRLTETTHILENLLDDIRRGDIALHTDMVNAFLQTKDVLKSQLDAYRASQEPDEETFERVCVLLRTITLRAKDAALQPSELPLCLRVAQIKPNDAQSIVEEMSLLGTVLAVRHTADSLAVWMETTCSKDDIEAVCCFIVNDDQLSVGREALPPEVARPESQSAATSAAAGSLPVGEISPGVAMPAAQARSSELSAPLIDQPAAPLAPAASVETTSIRVGVEKVDHIINLVGELVITQAMLVQTASTLDPVLHDRLLNGMEQLARNARDLQESVMSIRMMPMDYVFSRFPRMVRDLAAKMGKQIELQTIGGATELDKSLIERIVDPLTHLIRNSLDHGIETPNIRIAEGKEPVGQLVLSAAHSGGNIVIEVTDDGAGLSRERILARARAHGIAVNDAAPDDEVWQLIFAPGFSTAEQVTDISGRGVGMDVVRRNIHDMGGQVQLHSHSGQGTTTRIVLPLTLAILDGMSVRVGAETFILPLSHVTESIQPSHDQIFTVAGNERVLHVRGDYLPIVEMYQVFDIADAQTEPTAGIAVVMQAQERRFALLVDQLVGQHQVVVKNLESNYRKVYGVSAATIMGDGSVALIVDAFALSRAHREVALQPLAHAH
jgi:two-component system chemotaxis sensor kinase CheA